MDIPSDAYSDIACGTPLYENSDILSGILSGIFIYSDIPSSLPFATLSDT